MSSGDWHDLFSAAGRGDLELVRFHLARGVDPSYVHPEIQSTVLVSCLLAGHEEVAHLLLDHGADPGQEAVLDGLTPIEAARRAGVTSVERRLATLLDDVRTAAPAPAPVFEQPSRWRRLARLPTRLRS